MDANIINSTVDTNRISYLISNTNIVIALLITILSELLVFLIFIRRFVPKKEVGLWLIFIIGLNCLSNPLAQMVYRVLPLYTGYSWFLTEAFVILLEALLINKVMLKSFEVALFYSTLLNGTSILIGEILCLLRLLPWC